MPRVLFLAFLSASALLAPSAAAQTSNFQFTASAGNWTNGENWNNCVDPAIGSPCPYPLGPDDIATLPAGSAVFQDVPLVSPATVNVTGTVIIGGTGSVNATTLNIASGGTLALNTELRAETVNANATTQIAGTGRLRFTGPAAPVTTLSVATIECAVFADDVCDLTGTTVTSTAFWVTFGGNLIADGATSATLTSLLTDGRPLGPGGSVPGDIVFTGAPGTFDLSTVTTFDSFGTVDFNGGTATVANVSLISAFENGLRGLADLTVTESLDWNGGTIEVANAVTIPAGASVLSQSNNNLKGAMNVAGTLDWTRLSLTLSSHVNDPTPGVGVLTILPSGVFRAYSNSPTHTLGGRGAFVLQGRLDSDASLGTFPFPQFDTVSILPDSIAIDGGDINVLGASTLFFSPTFSATGFRTIEDATISLPAGTTLDLSSTGLDIDAATTITGAGTLTLRGGNTASSFLTSAAQIEVGTLLVDATNDDINLSGGTVAVDSVTVFAGQVRLPGGASIDALRIPSRNGGVEYTAGGPLTFETLESEGVIDFAGADVSVLDTLILGETGFSVALDAIGTFRLDAAIDSASLGRVSITATETVVETGATLDLVRSTSRLFGALQNLGTIRHSEGNLEISGPLTNEGLYVFDADSTPFIFGTGTFSNVGTFVRSQDATEAQIDIAFDNTGTVRLPGGTIAFTETLTNTGTILGTGTIDLPASPVVGGTIAPGLLSAGILNIDGPITLASDAILDTEIGGTTAGTDYDRLAATGAATLGGTLRLRLGDGAAPSAGDAFTVLTGGTVAGAFDSIEAPAGFVATIDYGAAAVTVTLGSVGITATLTAPTADPESGRGFRMLAPSITGATYDDLVGTLWTQGFPGADFPDGGVPNAYTYTEAGGTSAFTPLTSQSASAPLGLGFIVDVYADDDLDGPLPPSFPKTLVQSGTDVTGPFTFAGLNAPVAGAAGSTGWTIAGNPFAASLDWDAPGWTKTGMDNVFYVYDPATRDYLSWNGTAGSFGTGVIAPAQGFWVHATAAPTLMAPAQARTTGGPFVGRNAPAGAVIGLRLADTAGGALAASAFVTVLDGASDGADRFDAYELSPLSDTSISLYTERLDGGQPLDIQALAPGAEALDIPLGASATHEATLVLTWPRIDGYDGPLFVLDTETGEIVDLRAEESYTFAVGVSAQRPLEERLGAPARPAGAAARFRLVLGARPVADEPEAAVFVTELLSAAPNPVSSQTQIRYSLAEAGRVFLTVHDLLGREVARLADGDRNAGAHAETLDVRTLASGIYVVRMSGPDGFTETRRLTVVR